MVVPMRESAICEHVSWDVQGKSTNQADLKATYRQAALYIGIPFLRFHDLRHTCITKLAEGQASEQTLMSIAGHLSRKMLEHYSHIRLEAKRAALDAIAKPVFVGDVLQNPLQSPAAENAALPN